MAELEGDVDRRERRRLRTVRAAADHGHDLVATGAQRGGDGAAHVAGAGDECSHRGLVPLGWWDRRAGLRANEKAAVTASVSAALGAGPAAPSRSSRTKPARPVPPGRAASASASEDAVVSSRPEYDGKPCIPSSAKFGRSSRPRAEVARAMTGVRVPRPQAACAPASHQASKAVEVGAMGSGSALAVAQDLERLEAVAGDDQHDLVVGATAPPAMARRSAASVTPPAVSVRMPSVSASRRMESTVAVVGHARMAPSALAGQPAWRRRRPPVSRWPASARWCRAAPRA